MVYVRDAPRFPEERIFSAAWVRLGLLFGVCLAFVLLGARLEFDGSSEAECAFEKVLKRGT